MAAVLDALALYVKKLITDMAEEEVSMLLGVSGEITKLEDNMEGIKAFLADAERRRLTDESVQRWVRKLKNAMYDATDILDLCQLEADNRRESMGCGLKEKVPGCFQPLLFCLRNPVFAHEIGGRIKELNQRLDEIYKGAARFKFITNLSSYQDPSILNAKHTSLKTMSHFDETAIVGDNIEKDTKELAQMLITGDNNHGLKVVSIVGMGGMGKTTLAQKIFKETIIQEHFKIRIWLSITQHFDEVDLLRTAISHAGGHHGGEQDKSMLVQTLTNTLYASKFLLVMDDVWEDSAWDHVLSVPIKNASSKQPGSRVLVTTRFLDLARKMQASLHQHRIKPLDGEDAWTLLKKQLPVDQVGIDGLKSIGMEILKRCDGLPLAIKLIGGLLSTKYPSESEWKVVLNNHAWSVEGLPQELDKPLYLSYEDLSPQLKQCFLSCALFPEGTHIAQDVVISMWISEGFIIQPPGRHGSSHDDEHLENVAMEYYWGLIKRNLIQPKQGYSVTGYKCTLHDVVRSFAEYMAREEMLVVRDGQAADNGSGLVRRLYIAPRAVPVPDWAILKKHKSLRTLGLPSNVKLMPGDSLKSFSSLRGLYIYGTVSDRLVDSLCDLNHLRYLYLNTTNISRLPDSIHKMKFLQFIMLLDCKKLASLPNGIVKLVHLRYLDISGCNVSTIPKGFCGLTNLRSLYGFPVHVDDIDHAGSSTSSWCSLQELAPLSRLIQLTLHGLEKVPVSWMAEKALISSKGQLSYLEFIYSSVGGGELEQQQQQSVIHEDVLEKLCPPTSSLENFTVRGGYAGRQLPNWMLAPASAADFKSLRFLNLENLPCCTQLPDGLCCLPCMELLIIKDVPAVKRIGQEFQGPSSLPAGEYTPAAAAALVPPPFPKLRDLQLKGLCEWEEWEWNHDGCEQQQGSAEATMAMPCLEILTIDNCKLSYLPPGLANSKRNGLRELYLYELTNLTYVENFLSVVKLNVFDCPELQRISGLKRLHKIRIFDCPNVEVLEGAPSLDTMELKDGTMETLPGYLPCVNPRFLKLTCSKELHDSIISGSSSESDKISHIAKHDINYIEDSDAASHEYSDED